MRLKLADGVKASLVFTDVEGWEFSSFREQNVLMDVYVWKSSDMRTRERGEELEVPQAWMDAVMRGGANLYELDASVGLGGYVIAGSAEARVG